MSDSLNYRTMREKAAVSVVALLACLGLASCGGGSEGDTSEERASAERDFLGDCAHSFNVAAAARVVMPPTWANIYGARASINPDATDGACLITVANFKDQIANQYIQTETSWTAKSLFPSNLGPSVLNWNAEIVDGGYVHFLGGEQMPNSEVNACDAFYVGPDVAVSGIEVAGLTCAEGVDQLNGWFDDSSGSFEVRNLDDWSCSTEQVEQGQGFTHYECTRDDQLLRFDF